MFRRPTVIVVGAGASAEFRMPVGATLAERMSKTLNPTAPGGPAAPIGAVGPDRFDSAFRYQMLARNQWKSREIDAAFSAIASGVLTARSIDEFLSRHGEDQAILEIGKHAIARNILKAERESSLFLERADGSNRYDIPFLRDTWLSYFWQTASEGISKAAVEEIFNNVTFITFNYDRVIEYFLLGALMKGYRMSQKDAHHIITSSKIHHVYGSVGSLSPPDRSIAPEAIPFGANDAEIEDRVMGDNIKLYTEQSERTPEQITQAVESAETIVFLGLAYHEANMKHLHSIRGPALVQKIFGTAYAFSAHDVEVIKGQIRRLFFLPEGTSSALSLFSRLPIEIKDITAGQLFKDYSKSIAT